MFKYEAQLISDFAFMRQWYANHEFGVFCGTGSVQVHRVVDWEVTTLFRTWFTWPLPSTFDFYWNYSFYVTNSSHYSIVRWMSDYDCPIDITIIDLILVNVSAKSLFMSSVTKLYPHSSCLYIYAFSMCVSSSRLSIWSSL